MHLGPRVMGHRYGDRLRNARHRRLLVWRAIEPGVLLNQDVGVRPGDAERVHAGQARPSVIVRPIRYFRGDPDREAIPVERRVGIVEVQVLRNHTAIDDQGCLHEPGDSCGGLQMPDVGLHRTDQKRPVGLSFAAVDAGDGIDLDRIADRRSGSVRLQVVDFRGGDTGLSERSFDDLFQCGRMRNGQTRARPAVVHRRTADDRPDPVTVGFGLA